ncbi:MAG: ABC transporter substrate-binding protein [Candidatus Latescibacteria bacterium]|nr:ABC transporter substrate-binding protein [Candidatus Latescibacterota bacterium]
MNTLQLRFYGMLFFVLAVLNISGCGSPPEETDRVFRFRLGSDPPSLDLIHATDTSSATVVFRIFEGLVDQDPETLKIIPSLAERWEISEDGLTYTFYLKKGVRFHNGREVTSADFRYNFERCLTPKNISERSWVLAPIKGAQEMLEGKSTSLSGMETPDDYTVILHLEQPFTPFISYLTMEAGRVAAREGIEGAEYIPVGTGPYKFISWEHDIRVSLEANEDWHGGAVSVKRVDYEVIPDVGVAYQKFIAGELDLINEIPPGQLTLIKEKYPQFIRIWPYLRNEYIGFNHTRPPFKGNLKLRQALCWSVDRESIVRNLLEGASTVANSILPPGIPGKDETIQGYGYDPEKAKLRLAEAGYPGGKGLPEISLWYNTNEMHQQVAQIVQDSFRKIGVNIRLKSLDWPAYLKACQSFEPDMFRMGWVADIPDADNFLYILLDSKQIGAPGNYSGYSNPKFDRLVEEARVSLDEAHRIELYKQADRIATEDACWIMLTYTKLRMLFNPDYDGLVLPLQGEFRIPIEKLRYAPKK